MQIHTANRANATVVQPAGRFDAHTADEVRAAIQGAHHERVIVDLGATGFIDSTGLAVLVGAYRELGEAFALTSPSPAVRIILELTGLGATLPVHADVAAALAPQVAA